MVKNLESADRITKLVLSISILVLYLLKIIAGPFATFLLVLAILVITIYLAKALITLIPID